MIPILTAEGISKSFKKGKTEIPVIRGVNFSIGAGEMVAITGASGVGKSTLLHILGTLEAPSAGRVFFGPSKQDLFKMSERDLSNFRNRALGFVFQFHYLLPEFTALENVMMPALIAGHPRVAAQEQAKELLKFVGLVHRLGHRPSELSGGEQQRVAIARAIVNQPDVIIADEPTGNLDPVNTFEVVQILKKINDLGTTIILTTHNKGVIDSLKKRVITLDRGKVIRDDREGKYIL